MRRHLLALVLFLSGCGGAQPSVVPVVVEPGDTDKCPAACAHLRDLGCEEGQPLEDGTTCEKFCVETQKNGQPLNPTCVLSITACTEIESCTRAR